MSSGCCCTRRLCTARGGGMVTFKNTTFKITFFLFPVQWVKSTPAGSPEMNWKTSDSYHALHFITESLFVTHTELSTHTYTHRHTYTHTFTFRKSRGGNSNAIWITLCLIACLFLFLFQTGRWRWRRKAWNFAPWGRGRCLGSWLFSTTAPGLPLSRVSLHRHTHTHFLSAEDYRFLTLQHIREREIEKERWILLLLYKWEHSGHDETLPITAQCFCNTPVKCFVRTPVSWMSGFNTSALVCVSIASAMKDAHWISRWQFR